MLHIKEDKENGPKGGMRVFKHDQQQEDFHGISFGVPMALLAGLGSRP